MKVNRLSQIWFGVLMIFSLFFCHAEQKIQPPNFESVIGTWFGYDQDRLYFCRLELDRGGKGWFATVFANNPARLYEVKNWSLKEFELHIDLVARDKDGEDIYLKGVVEHPQLTLEMGGVVTKWHRRLVLLNEKVLEQRNDLVRERIRKERR